MKSKTSNLFRAILFMVLGILLCCSVINPNSMIDWIISISFLIGGTFLLILSFITMHSFLTETGLSAGFVIALGILFLPALPGGFDIDWMGGISMVMMTIGALFIVESLIGFGQKRSTVSNICILCFGAVAFTLGICLWLIDSFRSYSGLMLGILFILYSIVLIVSIATSKDIMVIDVSKSKEN